MDKTSCTATINQWEEQ